jgi:hypothetical protein
LISLYIPAVRQYQASHGDQLETCLLEQRGDLCRAEPVVIEQRAADCAVVREQLVGLDDQAVDEGGGEGNVSLFAAL